MYAIVEIAGQQFKVEEGAKIFVHHLGEEEGTELEFDQVLLTDNDGDITVGTPTVEGITVKAVVLKERVKGDKVVVFKKKRRKGYRVKNGHRQQYANIEITAIGKVGESVENEPVVEEGETTES